MKTFYTLMHLSIYYSDVYCMRKKILSVISVLCLLVAGFIIIEMAQEAEASSKTCLVTLNTGASSELTPLTMTNFEKDVKNASKEGFFGFGIIPYDTLVWRDVAVFETISLKNTLDLGSSAKCNIYLKNNKTTDAEVRVTILIDSDEIDSTTIEKHAIGMNPTKLEIKLDLSGYTVSKGSKLVLDIDVKIMSETCKLLGGIGHTNLEFKADPLYLEDGNYDEGTFSMKVHDCFGVGLKNLVFDIDLDYVDILSTELTLDTNSNTISFKKECNPGNHYVDWMVKYPSLSYTEGTFTFEVEETGGGGGSGGGGSGGNGSGGNSSGGGGSGGNGSGGGVPDDLISTTDCYKEYYDEYYDELSYIEETGDTITKDTLMGQEATIDITTIIVSRNGDYLEVTVNFLSSIDQQSIINVYFTSSIENQETPIIDSNFIEIPQTYQPANYIASTQNSDWAHTTSTTGSTIIFTGSLKELMDKGMTNEFYVFVSAELDVIVEEDAVTTVIKTIDYAGAGAAIIPTEPFEIDLTGLFAYLAILLGMGMIALLVIIFVPIIIFIALVITTILIIVKVTKKKKSNEPVRTVRAYTPQ